MTPSAGTATFSSCGRPVTGSKPSGNKKFPYQRTYTEGALYAPVTGYRSLAFGAAGLESIYEDTLTHRKGDVETTIDPEVQKAAFEALGERRGAAVALNARTGALLAVVSTPSYDPAAFSGNFPRDQEAWRKASEDKSRPMLNRTLREATAPGEAFDIVIAATALDHGLYDTVDEPTHGGSGECANATIREALARSCDENMAKLATELGEERLRDTAEEFGFGDDELLVPNRVTESRYESYGNGDITVTPLQLARVTAALANRGLLKGPHLVAEDEGGRSRRVSRKPRRACCSPRCGGRRNGRRPTPVTEPLPPGPSPMPGPRRATPSHSWSAWQPRTQPRPPMSRRRWPRRFPEEGLRRC